MSRRAGGGRAPLSLLLPAVATVALLLLPLAYLGVRVGSGGGRGWRVLTRANTIELIWSTGLLVFGVTLASVTIGVSVAWLEGIKANDPKFYEKNTPVVEAVASGEIQIGLVNHYYLYLVKEELGDDAPIANKYLPGNDPGALVSVAGAGVLDSSKNKAGAEQFVRFLLEDEQQRFYTDEAEEAEIPLVDGIDPKQGVPTLDELSGRGPNVDLSSFGGELQRTLELLNETGYTS